MAITWPSLLPGLNISRWPNAGLMGHLERESPLHGENAGWRYGSGNLFLLAGGREHEESPQVMESRRLGHGSQSIRPGIVVSL